MASQLGRTPVGIVAGSGRLPILLLESLQADNYPAVVVSVCKNPEPELEQFSVHFQQISPGQLRKIVKAFHRNGVGEIVLIGAVNKAQVFHPKRFDTLALKALSRNRKRGDRALLRAIAEIFEENELKVLDQRTYLSSLLPQPGMLTPRQLEPSVLHDAELGMRLARQMALWDVGQTVVLKDGVVVAVEAVEGTNAAIRRGAELAGPNVVVAKAAHPQHDFRFDVPTIGPETLELLQEVKASTIVIEAERAFLVDRERVITLADAANIAISVIEPETTPASIIPTGANP